MLMNSGNTLEVEPINLTTCLLVDVGRRTAPWKRATTENAGKEVVATYSLYWPEANGPITQDDLVHDTELRNTVGGFSKAITMMEEIMGAELQAADASVRYVVFKADGDVDYGISTYVEPWIVQMNIDLDPSLEGLDYFTQGYSSQGLQIPPEISKNTLVQMKVHYLEA